MKIYVYKGGLALARAAAWFCSIAALAGTIAASCVAQTWTERAWFLSIGIVYIAAFAFAAIFSKRGVLSEPAIETTVDRVTFRKPTWPWRSIDIERQDILQFDGNYDGPEGVSQLLIRLTDAGMTKVRAIPKVFELFHEQKNDDNTIIYFCDYLPMFGPTVARKLNCWRSTQELTPVGDICS